MTFQRSGVNFPGPKAAWRKIEYVLRHNSASGFHRIYQDNVLVWEVNLDDDGGVSPESRSETVWGGYAREYVSANNWRYAADLYYDHSLCRAMIGNASTYAGCTIVEPQIPTAWGVASVTVRINQAAIGALASAYLYVFDADGVPNSSGYALSGVSPNTRILFGIRS
jgi:hypothetical protein